MKKTIPIVLLATAATAAGLAGCGNNGDSQRQREAQDQIHQVEVERQQKIDAQKQAREDEQSKSLWQSIAFFLGIASLVLLIAGIILGSNAKHNVKP